MTTSLHNIRPRGKHAAGFTLVELMIAASIGSIILAGVLSSFLMLVRSGMRTSNYSMMESQTRRAFEQLGIDSRMASNFVSTNGGGVITGFTLTIPNTDDTTQKTVVYGYDTTDITDKKFYYIPNSATGVHVNLVSKVTSLTFNRYDPTGALIDPMSTPSDATVKHVQVSISVSRGGVGLASATQIIRSSAFTIRNISL